MLTSPQEISNTITNTEPRSFERLRRQNRFVLQSFIQSQFWFVRDCESIGTTISIGRGVPPPPVEVSASRIRTRTAVGRLVVVVESHVSSQLVPSQQENSSRSTPLIMY